ncbi:MAG: hypothetical protein ABI076_12075 [Acidobacteriaceae bacterium]
MTKFFLYAALASSFVVPAAHAQFGSGIVFDPTQSIHAAQQIIEANQLYTTTIETTRNVIGAYNLAQRMATAPQTLYRGYSNLGQQMWTSVTRPANTYGNTQAWTAAVTTGNGASLGNQQVSVPHTSQISGYRSLSQLGQQQLAAQGATADLGDTANATTLQTLGTVRANAPQREADINALEQASHSVDPAQQTELATLQRINQALLIQLRTQQEANEMTEAQSLQQIVGQKPSGPVFLRS